MTEQPELIMTEVAYLQWAGKKIAELQAERDALVRWMQAHNKVSKTEATILHTHGWELDEFYSECAEAYQAIPEATRKEIDE